MLRSAIIFLTILLSSTQLGLHLWPKFTYILGFRIDYLSPTISLLDILLILNLILNIPAVLKYLKTHTRLSLGLLAIFLINILFSVCPPNSIVWWTHLLLYLSFTIVLKERQISVKAVLLPLIISSLFSIAIAIVQSLNQGSVGGVLYWFGERTYSSSTPNIAKISLFGREVIRPYSTFSHPNSYAGFLLIIFILIRKTGIYFWYLPFLTYGILLSFSKAAILSLLLITLNLTPFVYLVLILSSMVVPHTLLNKSFALPFFVTSRIHLAEPFLKILKKYPLFGVGYGNYLIALSETINPLKLKLGIIQPVHNYFSLLLTEFGLVIPFTAIVFNINKIKLLFTQKYTPILAILLLATLDHYFYTLPQNKLILLISIIYLI